MKSSHLAIMALAGLLAAAPSLLAGEKVALDYHYTGNTGVSLTAMTGGPLSISAFTDQRDITDKHDINRAGRDAVTLEQQPSDLIRDTFQQAFESAGANLEDGQTSLALDGKLLEMEIQENASGIEVLIRCELTLRNQGRNAWQSVVFSRVTSEGDDVSVAIGRGLDRLVSELFMDDYFLMELGIF